MPWFQSFFHNGVGSFHKDLKLTIWCSCYHWHSFSIRWKLKKSKFLIFFNWVCLSIKNSGEVTLLFHQFISTELCKIDQSNLIRRTRVIWILFSFLIGLINDNVMAKINNSQGIFKFLISQIVQKARIPKANIIGGWKLPFHLILIKILPITILDSIDNNFLKIHLILSQRSSFISKNILNLSQILIDRSIISPDKTLILFGIPSTIFLDHTALE